MTYDELRGHVQEFFGDTKRSKTETKECLLSLVDEIQTMADTIDDDEEDHEDDENG